MSGLCDFMLQHIEVGSHFRQFVLGVNLDRHDIHTRIGSVQLAAPEREHGAGEISGSAVTEPFGGFCHRYR